MKTKKILFKFATRSRPEKFLSCIDFLYKNLADKENYLIAVTADRDDKTMFNKAVLTQVKQRIKLGYKINIIFGESKNKIHAINRDMEIFTDWDIVVVLSDDMVCEKQGFDNKIRQHMNNLYSDLDGCLHFDDGYKHEELCTMSIMGRKYFLRFNYLYYPSYISLFADDEFTQVGKILQKITYFPEILFRHLHPCNVGGEKDKQLNATESFYHVDLENYLKRKKINFNL